MKYFLICDDKIISVQRSFESLWNDWNLSVYNHFTMEEAQDMLESRGNNSISVRIIELKEATIQCE